MISRKIKLYGIIFSLIILIVSAASIQLVLNPDEVDMKEQEMEPQEMEEKIQKIEIWEDTAINESCTQPMPPEIFIVGANKEDTTRNENGTYTVIDAGEERIIVAGNYSSIYEIPFILMVDEQESLFFEQHQNLTKECIQRTCSQVNEPASPLLLLESEQLNPDSYGFQMNIHPNGNILVVNFYGFIQIYDENLDLVDEVIIDDYERANLFIHPNGNIIVHLHNNNKIDDFIRLYDENLDLIKEIIIYDYWINKLSIHPNGNIIVVSDHTIVQLYDKDLNLIHKELVDDINRISELAIYPNGNIVVVSDDTLIRIYDEHLNIIREEHAGENTADQFSDMIVDPINGNLIIAGKRHPPRTEAAPDGSMFLFASQALVQMYDASLTKINEDQFGRITITADKPNLNEITSVAVHPSGYIIAIGYINEMGFNTSNDRRYDTDAFLRIYDVNLNLIHEEQIASCATDRLYDVSVHQNGDIIVIGHTKDPQDPIFGSVFPFVRIYDISKIEELYG